MKSHEMVVRYSSSPLDGSVVNCGPVLNWLQVDHHGQKKLIRLKDESAINTPSIAAAFAIKAYQAQDDSEISLEVGDLVSVIDMPSSSESIWWRGKRGFEVGYFPSDCVEVIGEESLKRSTLGRSFSLGPSSPAASILASLYPMTSPVKSTSAATSGTPAASSSKPGRLGAFLRLFIHSRRLGNKHSHNEVPGKESVFGVDLTQYLQSEGLETPLVLDWCSSFIERCGLIDGIYRLSGTYSNIDRLRQVFNDHRIPDQQDDNLKQDVHCVASLLKMYFRELPIPLLTFDLYDSFIQCLQPKYPQEISIASEAVVPEDVKIDNLQKTIEKLPPCHYRTLEALMKHLHRVSLHGSNTGMTAKNIAIVWSPNLMKKDIDTSDGVAVLHLIGIQAVVTEYLIRYADRLFVRRQHEETEAYPGADDADVSDPSCLADIPCTSSTHPYSRPKSLSFDDSKKRGRLHSVDTEGASSFRLLDVGAGGCPPKYHTIIHSIPAIRSGRRTTAGSRRLRRSTSSGTWNNFSLLQAAAAAAAAKT